MGDLRAHLSVVGDERRTMSVSPPGPAEEGPRAPGAGSPRVREVQAAEEDLEAVNRRLRRALSLQRATLDATQDGILVVDLDGNVVSYNERFQTLWNLPDALVATGDDDQLIDYVLDQLEDPEGFLTRVREIYEDPETTTFDEIAFEDGRIFERYSRPQRLDGETIGRVWSFRDVTERVQTKRELERSNEQLEQFAYIVSHDLQEPLRMVRSYVELLERRYEDALDEDAQDFIRFASEGVERMQALIRGLLAYSRVHTRGDPFETVDLTDVLEDVAHDLEVAIEEVDAEVTWGTMPTVEADPVQLGQVLQNLISNAIKFRHPDRAPVVRIEAEEDEAGWRFSVQDNGIGIDPDDHERAFRIFQQLSPRGEHEGTGLGLALCQRIVERHGGMIGVESTPGEGSTFWFTLPDADA